MSIAHVMYSREFLSKTGQIDIGHHGSGDWVDCQRLNGGDEEIREFIKKRFIFMNGERGAERIGFDGQMLYSFCIFGDPVTVYENPSKNMNYETTVEITKAGSIDNIEGLSDLELFLIEKGFRKRQIK